MFLRVVLRGFLGMFVSLFVVAVCRVGVVRRFLVVTRLMMLGGLLVMVGRLFVVMSRLLVVLCAFLRHGFVAFKR